MKKIIITIKDRLISWARKKAEEENTDMSRLAGESLQQKMMEEEIYEFAMRQYLEQPPKIMKKQDEKYTLREDLYARTHF